MGIMGCHRKGCEEIMCQTYIDNKFQRVVGY